MSKRGRGKVNHKGRNRHFITEAEMEAEREKERKDREWRQRRGNDAGDEDDDEDAQEGKKEEEEEESEESEEESDSDDEKVRKPKGVDGLIEIQNPNRAQKVTKKVTELDINTKANLSRREREELERQQAHTRFLKLQAEGKTEQAQKDLARLAIIRKQREETARKREEAKKVEAPAKGKR